MDHPPFEAPRTGANRFNAPPSRGGRGGRTSLLLASALILALTHPVLAAPSLVGNVRYDDTRHALTIDTTGSPTVKTKRLLNPDRLVIDVLDSELSGLANRQATITSRKIQGFRAIQYSLNPGVVRLVVELKPGVEPLVAVRQVAGRVTVTLADSPPPKGEKDLETLPPSDLLVSAPVPTPTPTVVPVAATASPLVLAPSPAPVVVVAPSPEPTPTPPPARPTPRPAWPSPEPAVTPPPEFTNPGPGEVVRRRDPGFGSTVMVRWQQVETLEDYGSSAGPVFAYPAGLNGVEVRHWMQPWVGFGLDSRAMTFDIAAEGVHQHRTDLMVLPEMVFRYPFLGGALEPEVHLGYMGRHVTVVSTKPGSTLPFSPTQFYHGPTLGAAVRYRLLPALSISVQYQALPLVGGSLFRNFGSVDYGSIFPLFQQRYAIALTYDLAPAFVTLGYSDETSRNRAINYTQALTGILLGVGVRY